MFCKKGFVNFTFFFATAVIETFRRDDEGVEPFILASLTVPEN